MLLGWLLVHFMNYFQKIYEDHFEAQDELAERIKAIGGHANGVLGKMVADSKSFESDGKISDKEMIKLLAEAETTVASTLVESQHLQRKMVIY